MPLWFGDCLSSRTAACQCAYTGSCISQLKMGSWLEKMWPGTLYGKGELNYSSLRWLERLCVVGNAYSCVRYAAHGWLRTVVVGLRCKST